MVRGRLVLFTVAVAVGALATAVQPASAQLRTDFLTAGMVRQQPPPPPGGSNQVRHEGVGIGAKLGPIFTSFSQANKSFKSNTGFEGGIFFGGNRPGLIGVMGEILYARKGQEQAGLPKIELHYLEIPILARVNVGSQSLNGISVYGLVGPVFDILLKGAQNGVNVKKNYESLDVGVLIGAGVEITRFLVEGRYNIGVKNVLKSTGASSTDVKSRSFALLFGVRFN
jgi:hypothetical protein